MDQQERRSRKRISLATKFHLIAISLVVVTSAATLFFIIQKEVSYSYQELVSRGKNISNIVALNSEYGVYAEDKELLSQLIESFATTPDIAYVSVLNKAKELLFYKAFQAGLKRPHRAINNTDKTIHESYTDKDNSQRYIEVMAPVLTRSGFDTEMFLNETGPMESSVIGYIQLGLTEKEFRNRIHNYIISTTIVTAFIACIAIVIMVFMTKRITSPIQKLVSLAQDISKGNFDLKIRVTTKDEISELAQAFDQMLNNLRIYRDKVEERTIALTVANEMMENEIHERKRTEEDLGAEKERLAVTLRSIGDGVITTDIGGSVVLMNKNAEILTGWDHEEACGKPIQSVFHIIDAKTQKRCQDPIKTTLDYGTKAELPGRTILISKDGEKRSIDKRGAPIRDKNSKLIGVVMVFRDMSEQNQMEEELMKSRKLDSIGLLAGGIAHDFNNLLQAIVGNISLAKLCIQDGDDVTEMLEDAETASMRARDLTQQLLTFSKGGTPIRKTSSIIELIKDSSIFVLRGSNVRCEFTLSENLHPVHVDEGQINQVINNLMINANQAMPEGGTIKVNAENILVEPGSSFPLKIGEYVKITIEDSGIGISEKSLEKIFDPYFTTKPTGNGLGLATAYSIMKKHDGYMDVSSIPGVGTTFRLYLPSSKEDSIHHEAVKDTVANGAGYVLVLDDEELIRKLASAMLEKIGYDVTVAINGQEAIEKYQHVMGTDQTFDAVIMDITIPGGMGGKEALKKLREIDPHVKAIVSSGYSNDPIMADYKKHGFSGVIIKPYKLQDFSDVLHEVINGNHKN